MLKYLYSLLFVIICFSANAQSEEVFVKVDQMPEFPGGQVALVKYISKNLHYPAKAKKNKISGRVFVSFIINKEGQVIEPKILRGLSEECDEEALRIIKQMPKWKPGLKENKPVNVQFNMPLQFELNE